jgi:nucleotide-binding universal stress UspA family protein
MSAQCQPVVLPEIKKILYATDLSENSRVAVPYICAIASWFGAEIHVVHAISPEHVRPELDTDLTAAVAEIKSFLASHPFAPRKCSLTVERGQLCTVLDRCTVANDIDLIVLGTHGRKEDGKLVLGSGAEQILRHSACPVFTVGPHCQPRGETVRTVLFATDFSARVGVELNYAASICHVKHARLVLLHVVTPAAYLLPSAGSNLDVPDFADQHVDQARARAQQKLNLLAADEKLRGTKVETMVEVGDPSELILSCASVCEADQIVMGAHPIESGTVASHVPWAVTSRVVSDAHCPVLTVRS